jgi:hypothetical protein
MANTLKIIIVKDNEVRVRRRYRLYVGYVDDAVTHLALSLYGALTISMLREQTPEARFEETYVFADITRDHHPSPEHPGPIAKFWSQRPVLHLKDPFHQFAKECIEEWRVALSMAVIISPFNESAES